MSEETPMTFGDPPRYCPDCGRSTRATWENPLCADCGGRLALQGYCPICEARVRRRVGELCPKHDVELLADDRHLRPRLSEDSPISWITVKRFPDSLAATGARIRLDAEGIPTFIEGERMGAPAMYRVATGGVKLQVPAEFAADARVILSQDWSWPADDLDLDEGSATDDDELPPPEADSPRGFLIELVVVLALAIPLIAALITYLRGESS
jgi:hypothetical protein